MRWKNLGGRAKILWYYPACKSTLVMISHWWKIIHKSRSCTMTNLSKAPFCMTMTCKWIRMPEHIKRGLKFNRLHRGRCFKMLQYRWIIQMSSCFKWWGRHARFSVVTEQLWHSNFRQLHDQSQQIKDNTLIDMHYCLYSFFFTVRYSSGPTYVSTT